MWGMWRSTMQHEHVYIKFEIEICEKGYQSDGSISAANHAQRWYNSSEVKEGLSFSMCKKLVQVGNLIILSIYQFSVLISLLC
jgi:ethylene receptor